METEKKRLENKVVLLSPLLMLFNAIAMQTLFVMISFMGLAWYFFCSPANIL